MDPLSGGGNICWDTVVGKPEILDVGVVCETMFDALIEVGASEEAGDGVCEVEDEVERLGHEEEPVRSLVVDKRKISVKTPQTSNKGTNTHTFKQVF